MLFTPTFGESPLSYIVLLAFLQFLLLVLELAWWTDLNDLLEIPIIGPEISNSAKMEGIAELGIQFVQLLIW